MKWVSLLLVSFMTLFLAAFYYHRITPESFQYPAIYNGDGIAVLAISKTYGESKQVNFLGQKFPERLGAPYTGNWNDAPQTEDLLFSFCGHLVNWFGLGPGVNIALLVAHLLNALGAYWALRHLRASVLESACLSILFGISYYALSRNLGHLTLTYAFLIPPGLAVLFRGVAESSYLKDKSNFIRFCLIFVCTGLFNPYYTYMTLQLTGWVFIFKFYAKHSDRYRYLAGIGLAVFSFVLTQWDTLTYRWEAGENTGVVARNFAGQLFYGLHLPELFLPARHNLSQLVEFSISKYYNPSIGLMGVGEAMKSYIGVIGVIGFGILIWGFLARGNSDDTRQIKILGISMGWILIYSLAGGLNLFVGLMGLTVFRGSMRFSVFILMISLFAIPLLLRQIKGKGIRISVLVGIFAIGLWDIYPVSKNRLDHSITSPVFQGMLSDQKFGAAVDEKIEMGDKIFMLPVIVFPEGGNRFKLADYELFRTYLFSEKGHFSYGSNKGRSRDDWQFEIERLSIEVMLPSLRAMGFRGIIVHRNGFEDRAAKILQSLTSLLPASDFIHSEAGDKVFVDIVNIPSQVEITMIHKLKGPMFSHDELLQGDSWVWSQESTGWYDLNNPTSEPVKRRISFKIAGIMPGNFTIQIDGETVQQVEGVQSTTVDLPEIELKPGMTRLLIKSDIQPRKPNPRDPRSLTFRIINLELTP